MFMHVADALFNELKPKRALRDSQRATVSAKATGAKHGEPEFRSRSSWDIHSGMSQC